MHATLIITYADIFTCGAIKKFLAQFYICNENFIAPY